MEHRWRETLTRLMEQVEPDPATRRITLGRLRREGSIELLYSIWTQGCEPQWLLRMLQRLAHSVRPLGILRPEGRR